MPVSVSVIVPVYNAGEFLTHCVRSILGQSLKNIECILVDDGSTDTSPALCDMFAAQDSRVRVLHQKNAGPSAARNAGIASAAGGYIAFADADDWMEPDMCRRMWEAACAAAADLVVCDYLLQSGGAAQYVASFPGGRFTAEETEIRERFLPYFFGYADGELADYKSGCPFADYQSYVWLGLYRADVIARENIAFPDEKQYYNEDNLFNLLFLLRTKRLVHLPEALYHYRLTGESFTSRFNRRYCEMKLNKYAFIRRLIDRESLPDSFSVRLERKIGIETEIILNYYLKSGALSTGELYRFLRRLRGDPPVRDALDRFPLARLPVSRLKGTLALFKYRIYGPLIAAAQAYRRLSRRRSR